MSITPDPFGAPAAGPARVARRRSVDTVLAAVAAVLLPLGLLVIGLGWYGAAHTPYLFEQVPYLISGGLIGLGLVLTGGLLYFGSWIARGAADQQRASQELAGLLREIRDELHTRPEAAKPRGPKSNGHGPHVAPTPGSFVATAQGSMLHRPDCTVVLGREDLHAVGAEGSGLQPCGLCNPLGATQSPARP